MTGVVLLASCLASRGAESFEVVSARAAQRTYDAALKKAEVDHVAALQVARRTYSAELEGALNEAMAAKNLVEANKINLEIKRLADESSTHTKVNEPVVTAPQALQGAWRIVVEDGTEQIAVLQAEFFAYSPTAKTSGIWYVLGDTLVFRWSTGSVDKFSYRNREEPKGINNGGNRVRLVRADPPAIGPAAQSPANRKAAAEAVGNATTRTPNEGAAREIAVSSSRGFDCRSVKVTSGVVGRQIIGELTNRSGKNYEGAAFKVSLYDDRGELLEVAPFVLIEFRDGETKSFDAPVSQGGEIKAFKIQFEAGY